MADPPERIWAERSPISGDEWWTEEPTSLGLEYMHPYILDTTEALAKSDTVQTLVRAAVELAVALVVVM